MGTPSRGTSKDSPESCSVRAPCTAPSPDWKSEVSSSLWSPMTVGAPIGSQPRGRPTSLKPWVRCSAWPMKALDVSPSRKSLRPRARSENRRQPGMSTEHEQTRNQATNRSLLRWYPARWRDRYGDELAAMIEHDLEGATPTLRYRLAIARSGLEERMRDAGLVSGPGITVGASPGRRLDGPVRICALRCLRHRLRQGQ